MNLSEDTLRKLRGLILFTVVAVIAGVNWRSIAGVLGQIIGLLTPFITGACIAFVLNIPMRTIEETLCKKLFPKRALLRRVLSLCATLILVLLILVLAVLIVIPQLTDSLLSLQDKVPAFLQETAERTEQYLRENPQLQQLLRNSSQDLAELYEKAQTALSGLATGLLTGSLLAARGIAGAFANLGLGLIFAIYLLLGKERLCRQFRALFTAFLSKRPRFWLFALLGLTSRKFSAFIAGQCLEACILGLMFFVTLTVLGLPYAALIGVLIALTALIPVFGAFIGLFIGAFLMLLQSPTTALVFVVVFFVLQQIEGNLIYPHVVGGSVDLPAIWVLLAVTVGGSAFGIMGMLVCIPLFSVFYELLRGLVRLRIGDGKQQAGTDGGKSDDSGSCGKEARQTAAEEVKVVAAGVDAAGSAAAGKVVRPK